MSLWRKLTGLIIRLIITPLLILSPIFVYGQSARETWLKQYNESQDYAKRQQAMRNLKAEWAKYTDQYDRFAPWRIVFPEDNQRRLRLPGSISEKDVRRRLEEAKKKDVVKKLEEARDKEKTEARRQMMFLENKYKLEEYLKKTGPLNPLLIIF